MIPYMPQSTLKECVDFFRLPHLMVTASNTVDVLAVLHEDDLSLSRAVIEPFSGHPSVTQWRDHTVYLANYGMMLVDRLDKDGPGKHRSIVKRLNDALERQMSLAMTDEYSMDKPPWMGMQHFHDSHLSHFVTHFPSLYPDWIGKVPFGLTLQFP